MHSFLKLTMRKKSSLWTLIAIIMLFANVKHLSFHRGNSKDFIKMHSRNSAQDSCWEWWDARTTASFLQVWKSKARNSTLSQHLSTSNPCGRSYIMLTLSCNVHRNWFFKDNHPPELLKKKSFSKKDWLNQWNYGLNSSNTYGENSSDSFTAFQWTSLN